MKLSPCDSLPLHQAMGENLLAALPELATQIAHEGRRDLLATKAVFFDVLGYFMVRLRPGLRMIFPSSGTQMVALQVLNVEYNRRYPTRTRVQNFYTAFL